MINLFIPRIPVLLQGVVALALHQSLAADTVVQPTAFAVSNEGMLYTGTGTSELASTGFFTASVVPFDESLGTLLSFTIHCDVSGELSGSVESAAVSGTASGGLGGTFLLGGIAFDGTGGANGGGGPGGGVLQVNFSIPAYERTLQISDAGVSYDPAIADLVTGDAPFELSYSSAVKVDYANVADLAASVHGSLSITYTYEAVGGGVRELEVIGIVRNPGTGEVTIEWASDPLKTYRVEAGNGLTPTDFSVIEPNVPGESGQSTSYTETVPLAAPRRFYRIREN